MIKQRILYVGIGGSGLDLGIELDAALKREICGLDGNELSRRGLAYGNNELPPFVQQIYIDFAAAAVSHVADQLGGNVRTVTSVIPAISNYAAVAQSLRARSLPHVREWLPGSNGEPIVNPLSAGAGQYPTVGRAALFQSIQSQGLDQTILGPMSDAIADLSGSMGDLIVYTGGQCSTSLTVYVGFSVSGGTGSGLFYDVLMLLMHQLRAMMRGSEVVIIPTVLMPSTFDGVLPPVRLQRAKLNAASALTDLANIIDELPRAGGNNALTEVVYPGGGNGVKIQLGGVTGGVEMPVIAVTTSTPGMNRSDTMRMLASAIVTQVSLSGSTSPDGSITIEPTFAENLVNIRGDITMNPQNVLPRPLMPMVSASITMPAKKIADITAKRLLAEAFTQAGGRIERTPAERDELARRILVESGLRSLVEGETFGGKYRLSFAPPGNINNESDLRNKINQLKSSISSNVIPVVDDQIRENIRGLAAFDIVEGIAKVLGTDSSLSLPVVASAAQHALATLRSATPPGMTQEAPADATRTGGRGRKKGRSRVAFLPGRGKKITAVEINAAFAKAETEFKQDVLRLWWNKWDEIRHMWMPSANNGSTKVADLSERWSVVLEEASQSAQSEAAALAMPRLGVRDFVPTHGVSIQQALENIYADTKSSLFAERQVTPQTAHQLVQSILGTGRDGAISAVRRAVTVFRSGRTSHEFAETLLESLRAEVQNVFSHPVPGLSPAFQPLSSLLRQMVENPNADSGELQVELGNLVPGVLVPQRVSNNQLENLESPSVNITYPGEPDVNIENKILELVFSSDSLRAFMDLNAGASVATIRGKAGIKIAAVGDSDTLTVNINLIGQLLFEHTEVCSTLQTLQTEIRSNSYERLEWRQRLGFANPGRVLSKTLGAEALRQLILGLWGGLIELDGRGDVSSPTGLVVYDHNRQLPEHNLPRLDLGSNDQSPLNGWTGLLAAFENLLIDLGTRDAYFQQQVVVELLKYVPENLTRADSVMPPIIQALLESRARVIAEARATLAEPSKYGARTLASYRQVLEFWEGDFVDAWKLGSDRLHFFSLNQIHQLD